MEYYAAIKGMTYIDDILVDYNRDEHQNIMLSEEVSHKGHILYDPIYIMTRIRNSTEVKSG